jgi:hypothetical protein
VRRNRIDGDGAHALQITAGLFPEEESHSNTFARNRIDGFASAVSDVFLDVNAIDTVLWCQEGSLIDLGTGTRIVPCDDAGVDR